MADGLKIISPIDNISEVEALLAAGADELYGGFIPDLWQERYGPLASLNQRTFATAQISSENELKTIIEAVHARGRTFALTLNAPYYTDDQMPFLLDYVDRMVALGIDGLILADLVLLLTLRSHHPDLEYHASTLAHLTNAGSVRFYANQGITRAVLPRHLSVAEIKAIADAVPSVPCDVFMLVGKCPNTEGLCTFHHANPERIWPCEIPYKIKALEGDGSKTLKKAMARQASWSKTNRRHACGLCAIPALLHSKISGLKLVGRGAPSDAKIANVKMTQEFIALAQAESNFNRYQNKALRAYRKRFGSVCNPNVCYYPEFFPGSADS
ncbi:MAG: U32 family peptidase [Deltaproteobacteria bacterium]|jgi:putative protease|nr:U32 family peptidase [Deltaproteobacteria bacterium]